MTTEILATLPAVAEEIAGHLCDHFGPHGLGTQQMLAMAEEVGELTGAYRRWAGMARRRGSWKDVQAEMADVVITAHVTAAVLCIDLVPLLERAGEPVPRDAAGMVLLLDADSGVLSGAWVRYLAGDATLGEVGRRLADLAGCATATARVLGIDLDEAVSAKLRVVMTRGWRDPAVTGEDGSDAR